MVKAHRKTAAIGFASQAVATAIACSEADSVPDRTLEFESLKIQKYRQIQVIRNGEHGDHANVKEQQHGLSVT